MSNVRTWSQLVWIKFSRANGLQQFDANKRTLENFNDNVNNYYAILAAKERILTREREREREKLFAILRAYHLQKSRLRNSTSEEQDGIPIKCQEPRNFQRPECFLSEQYAEAAGVEKGKGRSKSYGEARTSSSIRANGATHGKGLRSLHTRRTHLLGLPL